MECAVPSIFAAASLTYCAATHLISSVYQQAAVGCFACLGCVIQGMQRQVVL
jgi:hypothetical protein